MKSLSVKVVVILIGLAIFGYAEVCKAQSAWVLWEKMEFSAFEKGKNQHFIVSWRILGAVPKYEECLEKLSKTWEQYKIDYSPEKSEGIKETSSKLYGIISISFKNGDTLFFTLSCLPDTVDPRK